MFGTENKICTVFSKFIETLKKKYITLWSIWRIRLLNYLQINKIISTTVDWYKLICVVINYVIK